MKLRETIVPIEEWLQSPYYLGQECYHPDKTFGLKKYWYDKICEYFRTGKREAILSGSSRAGKTFCVCIILLRYVYEVRCVQDFPTLFGLSVTTLPKIIFFSFSRSKADSNGIDRLIRMIDQCPYFQEKEHRRAPLTSMISFPWIQILSGVNISHAVGEDLLGAVIDEANIRHTAKSNEVREAEKLYNEIRQRSAITFSWKGSWKGFSAIISTAGSTTSFVDSKISEAKQKGSDIFITEASVYDVDPNKFADEHFAVFPGSPDVRPFIVDNPNPDTKMEIADTCGLTIEQFVEMNKGLLIHPPVDLKKFYVEDISYALSNLSGITQTSTSSLFRKESDLDKCFNPKLECPVTSYCPNLGIYDAFSALEFINENIMFKDYHGEKVYTHQDISKLYDYSGFSYLYVSETTNKIQALLCGDAFYDTSKPDNEISQEAIFFILKTLHSLGANFGGVSADQFASIYFMQQAKLLLGSKLVSHQSVDENPAAYLTVVSFAKQGMYNLYPNPKLRKELWELVYDQFTGKVDHPLNRDPKLSIKVPHDRYGIVQGFYGKDVADSFAGASFLIRTLEKLSYEDKLIEAKAERLEAKFDKEDTDFYSKLVPTDADLYYFSDKEIEDNTPPDYFQLQNELLGSGLRPSFRLRGR